MIQFITRKNRLSPCRRKCWGASDGCSYAWKIGSPSEDLKMSTSNSSNIDFPPLLPRPFILPLRDSGKAEMSEREPQEWGGGKAPPGPAHSDCGKDCSLVEKSRLLPSCSRNLINGNPCKLPARLSNDCPVSPASTASRATMAGCFHAPPAVASRKSLLGIRPAASSGRGTWLMPSNHRGMLSLGTKACSTDRVSSGATTLIFRRVPRSK
mmetsp:Transcript_131780/g.381122  ORF Transcript_131780/g.381122 Transcript_131780/m.381122 type:complete len:210 (+) Transcript_131780:453-1082(+)